MKGLFLVGMLGYWLLTPISALGHEARPLLVEIRGTSADSIVQWQAPPVIPRGAEPTVSLSGCKATLAPHPGLIGRSEYDCRNVLSPIEVVIHWPAINPALSTLLRHHGESRFYGPETTRIPVMPYPVERNAEHGAIDFSSFLYTGVMHLAGGVDHLLFIFAMTLIVVRGHVETKRELLGRLAWMVSGFTLAHSITLGLSVYDLISLPAAPTEAVIALSVVFVCIELARSRGDTLTWQYPALTSSAFGLLHGLGFAGVLKEVGLPDEQRLLGLLGFNLGVEIGQLAFVLLVCVVLGLCARVLPTLFRRTLNIAVVYSMGGISVMWLLERIGTF